MCIPSCIYIIIYTYYLYIYRYMNKGACSIGSRARQLSWMSQFSVFPRRAWIGAPRKKRLSSKDSLLFLRKCGKRYHVGINKHKPPMTGDGLYHLWHGGDCFAYTIWHVFGRINRSFSCRFPIRSGRKTAGCQWAARWFDLLRRKRRLRWKITNC